MIIVFLKNKNDTLSYLNYDNKFCYVIPQWLLRIKQFHCLSLRFKIKVYYYIGIGKVCITVSNLVFKKYSSLMINTHIVSHIYIHKRINTQIL